MDSNILVHFLKQFIQITNIHRSFHLLTKLMRTFRLQCVVVFLFISINIGMCGCCKDSMQRLQDCLPEISVISYSCLALVVSVAEPLTLKVFAV